MLTTAPHLSASAADGNTVVYLKDSGNGDGSSPNSAVNTLNNAYKALDLTKDCTIVICGAYTQSANYAYAHDYTGSVTITSVYEGTDYRKTGRASFKVKAVQFACYGKTTFENINIEALGANYAIIARHKPVTMGEGVVISGSQLKGGNTSTSFCIYGGYYSGYSSPTTSTENTNITVLSGEFYYLVPYSRNMKANYTGTATLRIGGTASATVHGSAISGSNPNLGDVKIELADEGTIKIFYGATEPATVNSYEFTWTGGSMGEIQWNCKYAAKADLKVKGKRILNVSEEMTSNPSYGTIASQFDVVNIISSAETAETVKNAETVYLKTGGKGDGSSAASPLGSLELAYGALDLTKDCTVVICGEFTQTADFDYGKDYTGSVTLTSVHGGTDHRESGAKYTSDAFSFVCRGKTVFENISFNATGAYYTVIAQHNPITIGEGVNITGAKLSGGSTTKAFTILGGYLSGTGSATALDSRDTNITVLSGSKLYVVAYSKNMQGDYPGTANIKIGGNANVSVLHGSVAYYMGTRVGNVNIEITDNAKIGTFYGCTQITTANSYRFIWRSGSISKFEWNCSATASADLEVTDKAYLYVSEDAKKEANFSFISSQFDVVEDISKMPEITPQAEEYNTDTPPTITSAKGYEAALKALGLLKAEEELDYTGGMARIDALVQIVRFMGAEEKALGGSYSHPFKDVPAWADKYVGYAYENKITYGVSATEFDPEGETYLAHYLTFLLRAIGYSDAAGEFVWDSPFELASKAGITKTQQNASLTFNLGLGLEYAWNTLYATAKNGNTVKENFIADGIFTNKQLYKASLKGERTYAYGATKLKAENGYYVLPIETYKDKTMAGLMAQFAGFLSGYEFTRNSDGSATVAMPDSWYEMCNGPYAERNSRNPHEDKLLFNDSTKIWEVWNDDDFSIDILDQYILRDMYNEYGTFASKKITDGWVKYNVYDMGGGHRSYGAYGLMKNYGYLPVFAGSREFGNMYNVNGEPYIGNETLGLSAAGMPDLATHQARLFGSATSDRDPLRWLEYFTALISMAYVETDIPSMMRQAQAIFEKDSWQWEVVDIVFELYEEYPDDWRRAVIHANERCWQLHYDNESKVGESSLNCAMILIGLLYGEGDFYETCKIISLAGHGGDSTTPVGLSAVGVLCGWSGMDEVSRNTINEKIWQDGKGVLVNRNVPNTKEAYWMFCKNLPERIGMQELLDLYRKNFESNLLANGGKIENGNYYIPENTLSVKQTVFTDEFEHGTLDGYTVKGSVTNAEGSYSGMRGAKLYGSAEAAVLERKLTGLTPGYSYKLSAFITSASGVTTAMYVDNGSERAYVSVYDQSSYVKRELIFTAISDTATIGFSLPAGVSAHKYAIVDEVYVIRAEETSAGTATIADKREDSLYRGTVEVDISAKEHKEYLLKLTFENLNSVTVRGTMTVNNAGYATVPFHATGTNGRGIVYIPVLATKENVFTLKINLGTSSIYIHEAELVEVQDEWQ